MAQATPYPPPPPVLSIHPPPRPSRVGCRGSPGRFSVSTVLCWHQRFLLLDGPSCPCLGGGRGVQGRAVSTAVEPAAWVCLPFDTELASVRSGSHNGATATLAVRVAMSVRGVSCARCRRPEPRSREASARRLSNPPIVVVLEVAGLPFSPRYEINTLTQSIQRGCRMACSDIRETICIMVCMGMITHRLALRYHTA